MQHQDEEPEDLTPPSPEGTGHVDVIPASPEDVQAGIIQAGPIGAIPEVVLPPDPETADVDTLADQLQEHIANSASPERVMEGLANNVPLMPGEYLEETAIFPVAELKRLYQLALPRLLRPTPEIVASPVSVVMESLREILLRGMETGSVSIPTDSVPGISEVWVQYVYDVLALPEQHEELPKELSWRDAEQLLSWLRWDSFGVEGFLDADYVEAIVGEKRNKDVAVCALVPGTTVGFWTELQQLLPFLSGEFTLPKDDDPNPQLVLWEPSYANGGRLRVMVGYSNHAAYKEQTEHVSESDLLKSLWWHCRGSYRKGADDQFRSTEFSMVLSELSVRYRLIDAVSSKDYNENVQELSDRVWDLFLGWYPSAFMAPAELPVNHRKGIPAGQIRTLLHFLRWVAPTYDIPDLLLSPAQRGWIRSIGERQQGGKHYFQISGPQLDWFRAVLRYYTKKWSASELRDSGLLTWLVGPASGDIDTGMVVFDMDAGFIGKWRVMHPFVSKPGMDTISLEQIPAILSWMLEGRIWTSSPISNEVEMPPVLPGKIVINRTGGGFEELEPSMRIIDAYIGDEPIGGGTSKATPDPQMFSPDELGDSVPKVPFEIDPHTGAHFDVPFEPGAAYNRRKILTANGSESGLTLLTHITGHEWRGSVFVENPLIARTVQIPVNISDWKQGDLVAALNVNVATEQPFEDLLLAMSLMAPYRGLITNLLVHLRTHYPPKS